MKHLPALDGLRAFAILTVAMSHIVTSLIPGGFGVTLFFFISGFIITRMMLAQNFGRRDMTPFYVRRFFRLAPALFVFIAISGLAMTAVGRPIPPKDYLATLLYYANYHSFNRSNGVNSPLGITWSLAVEEHFYFIFPILFILARKNLAKVLLAVIVAVALWRIALVYEWHAPAARTYLSTDTRIDSIAWGCLLSVMINRRDALLDRLNSHAAVAFSLAIILATFFIRDNHFRETIRYSLQGFAMMPIFCALFWKLESNNVVSGVLGSPPAVFVGNISYSLYLYHFLALSIAFSLFQNPFQMKLFAIVVGLTGAIASYYLVENPLRRFGSNLARSLQNRGKAQPDISTLG